MQTRDTQPLLDRLDAIRACAQALKGLTSRNWEFTEQTVAQIHSQIDRIWDQTWLLQRQFCGQPQVDGCWQEALEQATRVWEMVLECGDDPTQEQLRGLGLAGELLGRKVKEYQTVADMAAQCELMTGERDGLDRAAA